MRIALVVHDFNRTFGHSRYVAELGVRFARDHEVHVFANRFEGDTAGLHTHRVPAWRRTAATTIYSFLAAASVAVSRDFDIVHAQGVAVPGAHVITAHICNARWIEQRRKVQGALPWRERAFATLVVPLERRVLASSRAAVIAISQQLRDDLATVYGRSADTDVIPHGVDPAQFNPGVRKRRGPVRGRLGLSGDEPVFLFVGDLRKGFDQAIDALKLTPGILVGVTRSDPDPWLTRARAAGVAGRVRVLPFTEQIETWYGAADALVFPTPYDAFGMVITEAMACGLPVITTAAAGAAELIRDGHNGLLVSDPGDTRALGAAMAKLAADPDTRARLGGAALATMRAHTWDEVASRTLAVYERVVAARRRTAPSPSW